MPHSLRLRKKLKKKFHYRAPGLRKFFEKKNSSHYRRSLDLEKKNYPLCPFPRDPQDLEKILKKKFSTIKPLDLENINKAAEG